MHLNQNEKKYLIKSSNKIKGPFSLAEIIEKMLKKEVVGYDEVQGDKCTWWLVKKDPVFSKVFEEVLAKMESSKQKEDLTSTIEQATQSISYKVHVLDKEEDELEELSIKDYKNRAEIIDYKSTKKPVKLKKASYKKQRSSSLLYIVLVIAITMFLYQVFIYQKENKEVIHAQLNYEDYLYMGDYQKGLELINNLSTRHKNTSLDKIGALIKIEDYLNAEKEIKDLLSENIDSNERARLNNWLGIIHLQRQNFQIAKDFFNKALKLYPKYEAAKLNLVDTYLLLDNIKEANKYLLNNVKTESLNASNDFLRYEIAYFLNDNLTLDHAIFLDMSNLKNSMLDQKQELLFLLAFILQENQHLEHAKELYQQALSVHPDFFYDNLQSSEIYHPTVAVQKLIVLMKRKEFKYKDSAYYHSALSMLYYKVGSLLAYRQHLDKALTIEKNNPYIVALKTLDNYDLDYSSLMKNIMLGKVSPLEAASIGKYCKRTGNFKCEKKIWDYLMVIQPKSIIAMEGKIRELLRAGHKEKANHFIQQALGITPRYLPIRKIELGLNYNEKTL